VRQVAYHAASHRSEVVRPEQTPSPHLTDRFFSIETMPSVWWSVGVSLPNHGQIAAAVFQYMQATAC